MTYIPISEQTIRNLRTFPDKKTIIVYLMLLAAAEKTDTKKAAGITLEESPCTWGYDLQAKIKWLIKHGYLVDWLPEWVNNGEYRVTLP